MKRAMTVTEQRRTMQLAFNQKHNITPKGVSKKITDIMEGAYGVPMADSAQGSKSSQQRGNASGAQSLSPSELAKQLKQLQQKMQQHAKNLEFEEAASVRDEIQALRHSALGLN